MSTPDPWQDARTRADRVHSRLVELGATVATAESLTGGLIGALLTEAPATSVTYRGGLIVYGEDTKKHMAGVDDDLPAEEGRCIPRWRRSWPPARGPGSLPTTA